MKNKIVPFKMEKEILICGHCYDEDGLFSIGTDFIAFCNKCSWTVRLKSSPYPDLRDYNQPDSH